MRAHELLVDPGAVLHRTRAFADVDRDVYAQRHLRQSRVVPQHLRLTDLRQRRRRRTYEGWREQVLRRRDVGGHICHLRWDDSALTGAPHLHDQGLAPAHRVEVAKQTALATKERVPLELLLSAGHVSTSRSAVIKRSLSTRGWTSV